MNSDKLNEKKAQEILDRLDKDEFVFTMNDLEGEEYVSFFFFFVFFFEVINYYNYYYCYLIFILKR